MTTELNPWATPQPPEPRSQTRDERIEAATRALMGLPADHEWTADDLAPLSSIDTEGAATIWRGLAALAVQAAYPELTTADQLDALAQGDVLIGAGGVAWERVVAPGNTLVRDPQRCWAQQAWAKTRVTSADLVRNGETYVLAHRSAA